MHRPCTDRAPTVSRPCPDPVPTLSRPGPVSVAASSFQTPTGDPSADVSQVTTANDTRLVCRVHARCWSHVRPKHKVTFPVLLKGAPFSSPLRTPRKVPGRQIVTPGVTICYHLDLQSLTKDPHSRSLCCRPALRSPLNDPFSPTERSIRSDRPNRSVRPNDPFSPTERSVQSDP